MRRLPLAYLAVVVGSLGVRFSRLLIRVSGNTVTGPVGLGRLGETCETIGIFPPIGKLGSVGSWPPKPVPTPTGWGVAPCIRCHTYHHVAIGGSEPGVGDVLGVPGGGWKNTGPIGYAGIKGAPGSIVGVVVGVVVGVGVGVGVGVVVLPPPPPPVSPVAGVVVAVWLDALLL